VPAVITSTANERIKRIRALRMRKERDRTGLAYVEGIRTVAEAVQLDTPLEALVVAPDLLRSEFAHDLLAQARDRGVEEIEVSELVFRSLSKREGPQGLAAVLRQRWTRLDDVRLVPGDRWVALEETADAGNLGTILRTCDASGAEGVILLDHTTDPYDPVAMRASTGAIFTRRVVRANWEDFVDWARRENATLIGTSDRAADDYRTVDYGERTVLVMGSERAGLTDERQVACDRMVRIPMMGRIDSLNLAVATGLVLYEVLHHRSRT
jgi:RNA methyltransferase, TrmH family